MLDFVKISLILFEVILSAVVLVRTSNKDVLKDADDKVFVLIWLLFALIKAFAFLGLFESNVVITVITLCCLMDFIFIYSFSEYKANIKSTLDTIFKSQIGLIVLPFLIAFVFISISFNWVNVNFIEINDELGRLPRRKLRKEIKI